MADVRPVLVVITAGDCPACTTFKTTDWPAVKKALEDSKEVRIKHIDLKSMKDSLPGDVSKDLQMYRRFYPTMMIVPGDQWNKGNVREGVSLFNATYDPTTGVNPVASGSRKAYSALTPWVLETIKTSKSPPKAVLVNDSRSGSVTHVPSMGCSTEYISKFGF